MNFYHLQLGLSLLNLTLAALEKREQLLEKLKGKFNYASFDCAARILATNPGAKSSSSILQSQKDSYLLNLCSYSPKYVIIELCQDIRVENLILANYEYFSSIVRDFSVSVTKRYPPESPSSWKLIGHFVAENIRRDQVFTIEESKTYSRYLKIDFETHHGNEYYCLLSVLKVYGKTMMEDFEESSQPIIPEEKNLLNEGSETSKIVLEHSTSTLGATTITSSPSFNISRDQQQLITSDTERLPATIFTTDEAPPIDEFFKLLIKGHQDYCKASDFTSATTETPESEPETGQTTQENIFKAIYDRMKSLEKNVTKSAKIFQSELSKIITDIEGMKTEMGYLGTQSRGSKLKSFKSRILGYLERRNENYLRSLSDRLERSINDTERDSRSGYNIINDQISSTATPLRIRPPQHHRLRTSLSGALFNTGSSGSLAADESEQLVPNSPTSSDLISTAGKPLLLDESEAEIIDATYLSSPSPPLSVVESSKVIESSVNPSSPEPVNPTSE